MADKSIYKYPLSLGRSTITMPFNAKPLTVQVQDGALRLWALVDRANASQVREFQAYATGEQLPDHPGAFIATVQNGPYVWHVFDVT